MVVAELEAVSVSYGSRKALANVSMRIRPGITALLGANGAGKTTVMRVLATAERTYSGDYSLLGALVADAPSVASARRMIGWLPQTFGISPRTRVSAYVTYMAWLRGCESSEISASAASAIKLVGLEERARDRVRSLSGGMVRRLGIAQALVAGPRLLILDEPSSGLDPLQRDELLKVLQKVVRDTADAVVVSTHIIEDALSIATQITILRQGRVGWAGSRSNLAVGARREEISEVEFARRRMS